MSLWQRDSVRWSELTRQARGKLFPFPQAAPNQARLWHKHIQVAQREISLTVYFIALKTHSLSWFICFVHLTIWTNSIFMVLWVHLWDYWHGIVLLDNWLRFFPSLSGVTQVPIEQWWPLPSFTYNSDQFLIKSLEVSYTLDACLCRLHHRITKRYMNISIYSYNFIIILPCSQVPTLLVPPMMLNAMETSLHQNNRTHVCGVVTTFMK